jgi:hypothetical protein
MKLQSLKGLEKSIGGRPKSGNTKVRLSFYMSIDESEKLKIYADKNDYSVSAMVREIVNRLIKNTDNK